MISNRPTPSCAILAMAFLIATAAPASAQATASLSGRVLNEATARYVNQARVAVKGTAVQTFTDESGAYALDGLAPGTVTVVVSFTNTAPAAKTLTLVAGQRAELDFTLAGTGGEVVRLDQFRVQAAREVDAESISANEQRYSRNLKNVTSTDAMGEITQNNIGEFVKYLPGVGVVRGRSKPAT